MSGLGIALWAYAFAGFITFVVMCIEQRGVFGITVLMFWHAVGASALWPLIWVAAVIEALHAR